MSLRRALFLALVLLAVPVANAKDKDKKKVILPDYVLKARTVLIVINPEAGVSPQNPNANWVARQDVERAIMNWGRLTLAMEPLTADLVISVRRGTGKTVSPTITTPDSRPVILDPSDQGIRIGAQHGTSPPLTNPGTAGPINNTPYPSTQIGPSDDMFEVYRGRVEYPLDNAATWRYITKDSLKSPDVPAVAQFRKLIEEAEKQQQAQPKKP
jgi:hypothetical protein